MIMKKWILLVGAAVTSFSFADDLSKTCLIAECNPGDRAITYATKNDFYYACPTKELSEYISTTLGLTSVIYQMTGKLPNISPKTGEPEFDGESRQMVDNLRSAAGVDTYDQAQALCSKGRSKIAVTVMNNPNEGGSIWVSGADKKPFWMPKAFLSKR